MPKSKPSTDSQTPTTSKLRADFFTMPESYRHGKEATVVEPKPMSSGSVVRTPPVPVPSTPQTVLQTPTKTDRKKTKTAFMVALFLVVLAVLVSGYLFFRATQQQAPTPVAPSTAPTQRAEPKPTQETATSEPTVSPVKQEDEIRQSSPFSGELTRGKDVDSDGLTDVEEQLVYATNPNLPDTDRDGFLDGNEVFHQYNPAGTAPGTLVEAGLASVQSIGAMEMLYPTQWTSGVSQSENAGFSIGHLFVATTGEKIRVDVSQQGASEDIFLNSWKQNIKQPVVRSVSKAGHALYVSADNLDAFLVIDAFIVRLSYETGTKTSIDYLQTFQMMMNSLSKAQTQ